MAFLELAFNLPKNDRAIPFEALARKCVIPTNEVELMKFGKGSIDQINNEMIITWVAPKVLGKDKLAVILNKFDQWSKGVDDIEEVHR